MNTGCEQAFDLIENKEFRIVIRESSTAWETAVCWKLVKLSCGRGERLGVEYSS